MAVPISQLPGPARRRKPPDLRRRAIGFVVDRLAGAGVRAEPAPPDLPADLVVEAADRSALLVQVLAAAAPHHRGGRGSLGLHWMLRDGPADYVATVDLSRERGWLIPAADFRRRAQPLSGGRSHLDWIVVPLGASRSRIAAEHEFDPYLFERALPRLARRLSRSKEDDR